MFISAYLDKNVVADFWYNKIITYTWNEETIIGMKIISMGIDSLKKIIENKAKNKYLYEVYDKYLEIPLLYMNMKRALLILNIRYCLK